MRDEISTEHMSSRYISREFIMKTSLLYRFQYLETAQQRTFENRRRKYYSNFNV